MASIVAMAVVLGAVDFPAEVVVAASPEAVVGSVAAAHPDGGEYGHI